MRDAQLTSQFGPGIRSSPHTSVHPGAVLAIGPDPRLADALHVVCRPAVNFCSTSGSLKDSLSKYGQHIDSRIKQRLMQMKAGAPSRMRSCATKNGGISNATWGLK